MEWARREKRTFLRQRIEARLANLYLGGREYAAALALISRLLSEVLHRFLLLLPVTSPRQHRHPVIQPAALSLCSRLLSRACRAATCCPAARPDAACRGCGPRLVPSSLAPSWNLSCFRRPATAT